MIPHILTFKNNPTPCSIDWGSNPVHVHSGTLYDLKNKNKTNLSPGALVHMYHLYKVTLFF